MIIDATNSIAGRIATYAAKQALMGEKVSIINSEKAVITGKKQAVVTQWKLRVARGTPARGPFYNRWPDRLLRRIIRGMLPHKQAKGTEAYKRIMCYIGTPDEFKDKKSIKIPGSDVKKTMSLDYISMGDLAKLL